MSETQKAIIGSLVLFPDKISEVGHLVDESWFAGPYRKAFNYLCDHEGADVVSLSTACGVDVQQVTEWTDAEFSPAFLGRHIENLEKEATARKIQFLAKQLAKVEEIEEANKLIDRFQASMSGNDKSEPVAMKDALLRFSKELENRYRNGGKMLGAPTGLDDLDAKTEGLHTGDLVIIAAPASMGKTALAIGMAEAVGFSKKGGVLIFTFEMKTGQILSRQTACHGRIPLGVVRSARFKDTDWPRLSNAFERLRQADMYFDDPSGLTLSQVANKIRRFAKKGVKYVFIDYLQIMNYDKDHENKELDVICSGLKGLAKDLDVCVVLLSQLNRTNQKEKRKPTMHDLRGSGTIENHADVIIFPWREAAYCTQCQEGVNTHDHDLTGHQAKAEIIIGKQRQGERNIAIPVAWCGEQTRFYNLSNREEEWTNNG